MEPHDDKLNALLKEWAAPRHSAELEDRVMRARRFWWQSLVTGSIRVPVPLAWGLAIVLAIGGWRAITRPVPLDQHAQLTAPCLEAPISCQPNQRC